MRLAGFGRGRRKKRHETFEEEQRILRRMDSRPDLYELLKSSERQSLGKWILPAMILAILASALLWRLA